MAAVASSASLMAGPSHVGDSIVQGQVPEDSFQDPIGPPTEDWVRGVPRSANTFFKKSSVAVVGRDTYFLIRNKNI